MGESDRISGQPSCHPSQTRRTQLWTIIVGGIGVQNIEHDPLCSRNGGIPLTRICGGERTQRVLWIWRESGKRKRLFERWPPAVSTLVQSCRKHLCNRAVQAANLSHSLHPCQQLRKWAVFDDVNKRLTPLSNRKTWRMWPQLTVQKTKKEKVVSEV